MLSAVELTEGLNRFYNGTERLHKLALGNIVFTDGVRYLAENAESFWLINIIASVRNEPDLRQEQIKLWKLSVNGTRGVVVCTDGDKGTGTVELYRQEISLTDFPLAEIELLQVDNVVMLPSEY
jgi:hypothetical protein